MNHLSLPQMFIEPSSKKDTVLVYERKEGKLNGIPSLIFCPPNIMKVMNEMSKSDKHAEWDVDYIQSYMKHHMKNNLVL